MALCKVVILMNVGCNPCRYNFPDSIGVVGATHLPVATPRNCGSGYTNSSGWNSIVLLGVAGYNNKLGYRGS